MPAAPGPRERERERDLGAAPSKDAATSVLP